MRLNGRSYFQLILLYIIFITSPASAEPLGKRIVLKNGTVLLLSERHTIPAVTISMLIKAGQKDETADKAGLSSLTAELLTEGTSRRTSQAMAEEIEFVGGRIGTSGSGDYSSANLTVLKKDIELGLDILSDVIMNPIFPEDEIKRKIKETKASIEKQKDDPSAVASKEFARLIFGDHPYGMPVEGTAESLDRITRDDIAGFHKAFYAPNNCIIAVVGDITEKEAIAYLEKYFGEWKKRDIPERKLPEIKKPKVRITRVVDKNITQANIMLGHIGIEREHPDYYKVYVMNYILGGGGFSSRLMDNIRDNKGLAYDVHSYFSPMKLSGSYIAGLQTKAESAATAINEVVREMERIRTEYVSDSELDDAKKYLTGSFPLKIDTNSKITGMLTSLEFYNLGLDYPDKYASLINSITKEDILKAAAKYLDTDKYILVIVGDKGKTGISGN